MFILKNKFLLSNLALISLLTVVPLNNSASQVTPPLTKCYIRVDNPHLSKSLKRLKGFDAVKVNAVSTCNRELMNLRFTVEIRKKGFIRDYEVADRTIEFGGVIPANKEVAHKGTWVRCENRRPSRYYGIAYAKGIIDGKSVQTLPVITEKMVVLPCGTWDRLWSVPQDSAENLDDAVRDDAYFALFGHLISKNSSRYEEQAKSLLKEKSLVLRIDNIWVEYSLDRNGCKCNVSYDSGKTFSKYAWTRLGWTRKNKEKRLPTFFAQTEADVKFGLEN